MSITAWFTSWFFPLIIPFSLTVINMTFPLPKSELPQLTLPPQWALWQNTGQSPGSYRELQHQVRQIELSTITYSVSSLMSWYFLVHDGFGFSWSWTLPLFIVCAYSFYCCTNDDYMMSQYVYDNSGHMIEKEIEKQRSCARTQLWLMMICQGSFALLLWVI